MSNSLAQTGEVTCPQCQRPFTADIWLIMDLDEQPDLIQRIQAGAEERLRLAVLNITPSVMAPTFYLLFSFGGKIREPAT